MAITSPLSLERQTASGNQSYNIFHTTTPKRSGNYMYPLLWYERRPCILPTGSICGICTVRTTTEIIYIFVINQLLFLSEIKCVLFKAGTGLLHITLRNLGLQGRAMGQAVRRQTLTAEVRVWTQATAYGRSGTGTGVSHFTSIFPCHYHPTNAQYSS